MGNPQEQLREEQESGTSFQQPTNSSSGIDIGAIIVRAKSILTDPVGVWNELRSEQSSIRDVYMNYILVMAAIPAVCGFLGSAIVGVSVPGVGTMRVGFFSGLYTAIVTYALSLATVYIGALVIETLAPKFDGVGDRTQAFKLLAYSYTAAYIGGFLTLIPVLGVLGILFGLYSLYTFYQGIPAMTAVPDAKRLPFAALTIVCLVVVMMIVGGVVGILT